jgi:hypothetical protein
MGEPRSGGESKDGHDRRRYNSASSFFFFFMSGKPGPSPVDQSEYMTPTTFNYFHYIHVF